MNILFLASDYPNKYRANFEFVRQLVDAIANRGNHCYVIAPYSITHEKRLWRGIEKNERANGGSVVISRPNFLSFSNFHIGKFRPSYLFRKKAVYRALKRMDFYPDVAYGHFWGSGWLLYDYARNEKLPLFVATGESNIAQMFNATPKQKPFYDYVSGVICVSSKNKEESISLGLTTHDRCLLALNSVNSQRFQKMNREECRTKLNLPLSAFIVAFTGWFKPSKGAERVAKAIEMIEGEPVYSVFIGGKGTENPQCRNILFKGELCHSDIPFYLNSADVFVLPTLQEGLCNSIVEAMACGLPIISSNLHFNWDILDETNSIMIDPNNIEEIAQAIVKLRDDKELRQRLSNGSLLKAKELTIDKRAEKIESFIKEKTVLFKEKNL